MTRTTTYLLFLGLLLITIAACGSGEIDPSQFRGTTMPSPIPAPDFTLSNADGEAVSLSDFQEEIVLLYFGYTFCPDICPTTLSELKKVQQELDEKGEKIQVLMVTVDPQRDTREKLAEYVTHFHPDFIGLSGTKEEIDAAGEGYGLYYEKHEGTEATGYLVDHTARVFVVDPEGNYQLSFSYGTPVEDIVHDLRLIMRGM
jgi:protein SCO1/2